MVLSIGAFGRAFRSASGLATKQLRNDERTYHRRPEQWSDTEATDHESDGKRHDDVTHVELVHDIVEVTGNDGGCKRHLDDRESAHGGDI